MPTVDSIMTQTCASRLARAGDFKAHIESERTRLTAIDDLVKRHRDAIGILFDEFQRLRGVIVGRDLKKWIANQPQLAEPIKSISQLRRMRYSGLFFHA
jgi:hypothetical protein